MLVTRRDGLPTRRARPAGRAARGRPG